MNICIYIITIRTNLFDEVNLEDILKLKHEELFLLIYPHFTT